MVLGAGVVGPLPWEEKDDWKMRPGGKKARGWAEQQRRQEEEKTRREIVVANRSRDVRKKK